MKKVISMLLVLSMLFGLMPTIALGAEGDSFDVTFLDLKEGCYLATTTVGSNWKIDTAKSGKVMVNGTKNAARWQVSATYAFLQIVAARGDLALKFTAPSEGTYDIIVHHQPYASGPNLDLYINDTYVGTVDGKDANGSHTIVREQKIAGVTLKAGEYANSIVMRASSGKFQFQGITFVETSSPAGISEIEAEVDNNEMFVGTTQKINVSAQLANGGSYDIAKGAEKIEYDVSDPSVATVSDDGVLSAVGAGNATVTVTATVNTKPYTATLDIIAKVPVINEMFVTVPRYILLDDADGETLTVSAKLTDGTDVDMSTATVSYTSQNEFASVSDNGIVTPVSEGIAQILVRVTTPDGKFKEKTVEIPISKEVIYPSFELYFNEEYAWDKVTSDGYFTADTHGSNWTVNKVLSADIFYGGTTNAARIQKDKVEYIYLKNYGDFAVDFTVPESGYYDLTAEAIQYISTGLAKFYVDGKYVGEYDTYASPGDIYTSVPKKLRSLYLEEGKTHTLLIRNGGKTSGGTNLFIRSVGFEGRAALDGISKVEIEKGRSTYAAGESDDYKIRVTQNNGAVYYLPLVSSDGSVEVTLPVTSSEENIVSVSDGSFKAKAPGRATLTTAGKLNGYDVSGSTTVTVSDVTYKEVDVNLYEDTIYFTGSSKMLEASVILSDGSVTDARNVSNVHYEISCDPEVAKIENGVFYALSEGEATVTAYATFNNTEKSVSKTVKIENVKLSAITAETEDTVVSALDEDGSRIIVTGVKNNGETVALDGETTIFSYENLTPDIIVADEGYAYYVSRGVGTVRVTAKNEAEGWEFSCDAKFISSSSKAEPTIYTNVMRENALKNAKTYDWAKSLVETTKKNADKWVENIDLLYDAVPTEGIPRGYTIATLTSPANMTYICPGCEVSVAKTTGAYSWVVDPINRPWKVQCPNCKRLFPSNDFESFYKLGITDEGTFSRELALENHRALFADEYAKTGRDYGYGYLKNELYSDKDSTWMVDDGFGWSPRDGVPGSDESVVTNPKWSTIAHYHHKLWNNNGAETSILSRALMDLYEAYLYTGDKKYGRAGVILLDRMADVYPAYDIQKVSLSYPHSHGGDYSGKTVGNIWETRVAEPLIRAYDAFYPMMDDSEVIKYLSERARTLKGVINPKTSGDLIRENIENNVIRESFRAAKEAKIFGNFGMHQLVVTLAAVALDVEKETNEMFDWLIKPFGETKVKVYDTVYQNREFNATVETKGGEMLTRYMNEVDRDGFGNEAGVGYNLLWLTEGLDIAETIYRYGADSALNLFENPKFVKMFNTFIKEHVGNGYVLHIGDSGAAGNKGKANIADSTLRAFNMLGDPQLAKNYYWAVGGELDDIHIDMFSDNSSLADRIQKIIDEEGEYKFVSENLTGFGLGLLRGGELVKSTGAIPDRDFRHDVWMYYGRNSGHGHRDMLQIGVNAYGFNFMPDLGYPEATGNDENRFQWVMNTLSHNTVVVNDDYQNGIYGGTPLHFDSTDTVQIMDVEAPNAYAETEEYRRTVVSVAASNEVAYTVDFFRVKGGKSHTYSFHTQSYMGYSTDDLTLVPQVDENGNYEDTYAGHDITAVYLDPATGKVVGEKEVEYGGDPNGLNFTAAYTTMFPRGYTWLTNVNRAKDIESGSFTVNFKQTDFNKQVADSSDLNMKYTAVNDWTPTGLGIVTGYAPRTASNKNVPGLDYMLIHRTSDEELDTLFTSVLQPYKGEEYIADIKSVPVLSGGEQVSENEAKAVRVTLTNGRVDYVIYAPDSEKTYAVSDKFINSGNKEIPVSFNFNGFVGVYTVNDEGKNIYSYMNDGTLIGEMSGIGKYTGEVVSFTEELTDKNYITVSFNEEVDLSRLAGEYIYIANTGTQNGSYRIISAEENEANSAYVDLFLGDVNVIKSYAQNANPEAGFLYNIAKFQKFEILLSEEYDVKPDLSLSISGKLSVSAGSSVSVDVNAGSEASSSFTFVGKVLPRGASVNSETGVVTWKPDSSQVGEAGFVIAAVDEDGREGTVSFEITVYGSTTGASANKGENESSSGNAGGSAGGGGGGGAAPTDKPEIDDGKAESDSEKSPEASGETEKLRFTDTANHAWAENAINELAADGIIKGTTASTFSPASNITRADFAILLVRAFKLKSENAENFADVNASDYFASEIAIARNTGIVNGIGDNKYAPRNTITRQDMMVIVHRALNNKPLLPKGRGTVEDGGGIYPDFATVAPYAKEAVTALIGAGLVNGKSGLIAPADYTTRAEVAVLIKRILDYKASLA